MVLFIYRYICLRNPFYTMSVSFESDSHYVEETLVIAERKSALASKEGLCSLHYICLFLPPYIFLRRSLYALAAGLHLHKMYSISIKRYDVYLKMSASEVPFENRVTDTPQEVTCQILSQLS